MAVVGRVGYRGRESPVGRQKGVGVWGEAEPASMCPRHMVGGGERGKQCGGGVWCPGQVCSETTDSHAASCVQGASQMSANQLRKARGALFARNGTTNLIPP